MMMMSYVAMGVVGIVYVLWGWSMSLRRRRAWHGGLFANPFTLFGLKDVELGLATSRCCFQLTFAVITAALISGAIADRVKLSVLDRLPAALGDAVLLPARPHGLGRRLDLTRTSPAQDYAGGTVVHINAGVAGGVLALIIGRRVGFGATR